MGDRLNGDELVRSLGEVEISPASWLTEIREMADRISAIIKQSDLPRVDVEIEVRKFREYVLEHFPEKEELFKAIYINRFRRLGEEHRKGEGPLFGWGKRGA
jgi:hypothetical protein